MLCVSELHRAACERWVVHGLQGACGCAGLAVENICDDGVESGVCSWAEADYCGDEQAAVAEHVEYGEHGAAGFDCGGEWAAGLRRRDAGGLHQAAGSDFEGL